MLGRQAWYSSMVLNGKTMSGAADYRIIKIVQQLDHLAQTNSIIVAREDFADYLQSATIQLYVLIMGYCPVNLANRCLSYKSPSTWLLRYTRKQLAIGNGNEFG